MAGQEPEQVELTGREPQELTVGCDLARARVELEASNERRSAFGTCGDERRSTVRTRAASSRGENGFVT